MPGIVPLGSSTIINASSSAANVSYSPNLTNTFRFVNVGASPVYVGVYNDPTVAANIAIPTSSAPVPGVVAIAPGWFENVSGNFGAQNQNTIYCAAIASASSVQIIITPVRD